MNCNCDCQIKCCEVPNCDGLDCKCKLKQDETEQDQEIEIEFIEEKITYH